MRNRKNKLESSVRGVATRTAGRSAPTWSSGGSKRTGAGGQRIRVLEPAECAARWPVLDLDAVTSYDNLPHGGPRRLEPDEVRSLIALLALSGPRQ